MCDISPEGYELALVNKLRHDFAPVAVRVEGTSAVGRRCVIGRYSLVPRQLDVAAYGVGESTPFLVADAKRHARKLDVKQAEMFIGMLDDVGARIGLLVSPAGFTAAAVRRSRAAATHVMVMTLEEALAFCWLDLARALYPGDWLFHLDMAKALQLLDEGASSSDLVAGLEALPFDEWESLVAYSVAAHPDQARELLQAIAEDHVDDGWRFNACQHLEEAGWLSEDLRRHLLARERDHDVRKYLEGNA